MRHIKEDQQIRLLRLKSNQQEMARQPRNLRQTTRKPIHLRTQQPRIRNTSSGPITRDRDTTATATRGRREGDNAAIRLDSSSRRRRGRSKLDFDARGRLDHLHGVTFVAEIVQVVQGSGLVDSFCRCGCCAAAAWGGGWLLVVERGEGA
jgi:hypothetical protein